MSYRTTLPFVANRRLAIFSLNSVLVPPVDEA